MKNHLILIFGIAIVLQSCSYHLVQYLEPNVEYVYKYDCEFKRGTDTLFETRDLIFQSKLINNEKVLYAFNVDDTNKSNPIIGTTHFLFSVMKFEKNGLKIAPVFWKNELEQLQLEDFRIEIPAKVSRNDTIQINDGNKTIFLTDFHIEKVDTKNLGRINKCLAIKKIIVWPDATYEARIWLHKEYGTVKWIRQTGRIEELKQLPILYKTH